MTDSSHEHDRTEPSRNYAPLPRPCPDCGVGEAQRHLDDCPAVAAMLEAGHTEPRPGYATGGPVEGPVDWPLLGGCVIPGPRPEPCPECGFRRPTHTHAEGCQAGRVPGAGRFVGTPLEVATDAAARKVHELASRVDAGIPVAWDDLHPVDKLGLREQVMPVVAAALHAIGAT